MLGKLNDIFERRTKQKLALASVGQVVVAMLDTLAVALVLPLVDLATGAPMTSGAVGFVSNLLGNPDRATLTIILTVVVVSPFTTVSRRSTAELVRTMNDSVSRVFDFTVGGLMSAMSSGIAILAIVA